MQKKFNDVLFDLLTIIKYPNNKERFIKEFEELNHLEAISNLMDKFPVDIQEHIKASEGRIEEIKKYIQQEEYVSEVAKVSKEALIKFIEVVSPLLNLEQKQRVVNLLKQ